MTITTESTSVTGSMARSITTTSTANKRTKTELPSDQPTIYIVDDDWDVCESLTALLSTMQWNVETFQSALAFYAYYKTISTTQKQLNCCLLLDIRMPQKSGLTLLEELTQDALSQNDGFQNNNFQNNSSQNNMFQNSLPIIIMTGHGNIELCRRAFKQGAFEFLTKPIDADLLIETINQAIFISKDNQVEKNIQRDIQTKISELGMYQSQWQTYLGKLSEREKQIILLIVQGKTNKEIANQLFLSIRTVETHRANLLQKLNNPNIAELIKIYSLAIANL